MLCIFNHSHTVHSTWENIIFVVLPIKKSTAPQIISCSGISTGQIRNVGLTSNLSWMKACPLHEKVNKRKFNL